MILRGGSRVPIGFGNQLLSGRIAQVMRRHDLHTVAVESILNGRVHIPRHSSPGGWQISIDMHHQSVNDVEVRQSSLHHIGSGDGENLGNAARGLDQQSVDLSLGGCRNRW